MKKPKGIWSIYVDTYIYICVYMYMYMYAF